MYVNFRDVFEFEGFHGVHAYIEGLFAVIKCFTIHLGIEFSFILLPMARA